MKKLREQNKELYDVARHTWDNFTNADRLMIYQLFGANRHFDWFAIPEDQQRTMVELVRNVVAVYTSIQSVEEGK